MFLHNRGMAVPSPNQHLSRIDNKSSHGWMVRISRPKVKISKFFSDSKYKGKRLAQYAARDFRDEKLKELEAQGKTARAQKLVWRQKNNTTGVIGITRTSRKKADGTTSDYLNITWRPQPGVQRATSISIEKYGELKAMKKAVAIRNKHLKDRHGSGVFRKLKYLRDTTPPSTPDSPKSL